MRLRPCGVAAALSLQRALARMRLGGCAKCRRAVKTFNALNARPKHIYYHIAAAVLASNGNYYAHIQGGSVLQKRSDMLCQQTLQVRVYEVGVIFVDSAAGKVPPHTRNHHAFNI